MANFLGLPSELIAHVFQYLDDADVMSARLTSTYVNNSSLAYFGPRFFRKKGYLVTSPSIDVLKSIAGHQKLRKQVQHVWFNPDCYTFVVPQCAPQNTYSYDQWEYNEIVEERYFRSKDDRRRHEAYRACVKDHTTLLHTSELERELTMVFGNLANLQAVGMRRSEDHHPWGWTGLLNTIGEDPRILGPIPSCASGFVLSSPTRLFAAMLRALAAAHVEVKRLYTDAVEIDDIPQDDLPPYTVASACRSVLYLEINVSKVDRARWRRPPNQQSIDLYGEGLVRLLAAMPQLRELGLQIFGDLKQSHMVPPNSTRRGPGDWRQSYPYLAFQKLAHGVRLSTLRRLKLEKITTTPQTLEAFMSPARSSLTSLKFRDVRLLASEDNERPWRSVFEFLRDQCEVLDYILFYHLLDKGGGVSFVEYPSVEAPSNDETQYTNGFDDPEEEELFTEYDHIGIEASGRLEVEEALTEIVDKHWYQKPIFSYAMDESLWHTDTSDDEW